MIARPWFLIPSPVNDLDTLVRRADEDRWLATRFAPEHVRERFIAIYALNYEIAHVREVVAEPALAQIRLTWWRDAIEGLRSNTPSHPVLDAYARMAPGILVEPWMDLIEARIENQDAFTSWEALESYFARTAGAVMHLALLACGEDPTANVRPAGVAWGYQGFLRTPSLRGRLPGAQSMAIDRARAAYAEARAHPISQRAFPAIGYLALVPGYLRAIERNAVMRPLLMRQLTLVAAAATGRV